MQFPGDKDRQGGDQRIIGAAHQEIGEGQQRKIPVPELSVHLIEMVDGSAFLKSGCKITNFRRNRRERRLPDLDGKKK